MVLTAGWGLSYELYCIAWYRVSRKITCAEDSLREIHFTINFSTRDYTGEEL